VIAKKQQTPLSSRACALTDSSHHKDSKQTPTHPIFIFTKLLNFYPSHLTGWVLPFAPSGMRQPTLAELQRIPLCNVLQVMIQDFIEPVKNPVVCDSTVPSNPINFLFMKTPPCIVFLKDFPWAGFAICSIRHKATNFSRTSTHPIMQCTASDDTRLY
jgi:hypothetical protein